MQHLMTKIGFSHRGTINVYEEFPLQAYEIIVK
jgi:hypothetical protein